MRLHKPAGSCPRPARPVHTQGHPTRPGRWGPSPARTQRLVGMVTGRSPRPEAPDALPGTRKARRSPWQAGVQACLRGLPESEPWRFLCRAGRAKGWGDTSSMPASAVTLHKLARSPFTSD